MVAVTHPLSDPAQGLQTEHPLLEDGTPHETEELGQSVSCSLWEGGGRDRGGERGGEGRGGLGAVLFMSYPDTYCWAVAMVMQGQV